MADIVVLSLITFDFFCHERLKLNILKNTLLEKQYIDLCDACDKVLISSSKIKECVALDWLHIVRKSERH